MRLVHLLVFTLCLTTCLAQGRRRRSEPPKLEHLTHQEARFESEAVGDSMPYGVYLPLGYEDEANEDKRWPLVIWLHGMWEDHRRFHTRGGGKVLDDAVGKGDLPPCVFVLANGGRTSMYVNAGEYKDYQDLIQQDLIAHIDAEYRVSKKRSDRALMGISMGGMAAMRIAWENPELFGTVACHSSAVFPMDPKQLDPRLLALSGRIGLDKVFGNPIDEELWRKTNPLCIASELEPAKLDGLGLWFDAGTADRLKFHIANEALHEQLEKRKVPHEWQLVQGSGHAWGDGVEPRLAQSLKWVGDRFRSAAAGAGKKRKKAPAAPVGAGKDG